MGKRIYRRATKYDAALNVNMTQAMRAAIENLAEQYGVSVVEMARRCISNTLEREAAKALEEETAKAQRLSNSDETEAKRHQILDETDKVRRERVLTEIAKALHKDPTSMVFEPDRNPHPEEVGEAIEEAARLGLDDVVTLLTAKHSELGDNSEYHYLAFALIDIAPEEYVEAAKERLMSYYPG